MDVRKKLFLNVLALVVFLISNPTSAKIDSKLNPRVLKLALAAYWNAKLQGYGSNSHITIVDYSLPSTKKRLWVLDVNQAKILINTYVAHGIGSGPEKYAKQFSNEFGSKMSSLGLFVTGKIYHGKYGKSLNLHGIDGQFNSNAYSRRIVVHEADYVDENVIKKLGRLGVSFGCLALKKRVGSSVMDLIKHDSLVFCYYPDKNWLKNSEFLEN